MFVNKGIPNTATADCVPINLIDSGHRFRQDAGDIAALAQSIQKLGLLHPIVVANGYMGRFTLICGQRRLLAFKELHCVEIPVRIVDLDNPLVAEHDENECRKPFTPSERVAIATAIEEAETKKAKKKKEGVEKFSTRKTQAQRDADRPTSRAAKAVGMSRPTYEKAKAVVEAAEKDPELAPIVEEMDRTGKVEPAFRKVAKKVAKAVKKSAKAAEPVLDNIAKDASCLQVPGLVAELKHWGNAHPGAMSPEAIGMIAETLTRRLNELTDDVLAKLKEAKGLADRDFTTISIQSILRILVLIERRVEGLRP